MNHLELLEAITKYGITLEPSFDEEDDSKVVEWQGINGVSGGCWHSGSTLQECIEEVVKYSHEELPPLVFRSIK